MDGYHHGPGNGPDTRHPTPQTRTQTARGYQQTAQSSSLHIWSVFQNVNAHSARVFAPFERLHSAHAGRMLLSISSPPRDSGTTWSRCSARASQYAHRPPHRTRIALREYSSDRTDAFRALRRADNVYLRSGGSEA